MRPAGSRCAWRAFVVGSDEAAPAPRPRRCGDGAGRCRPATPASPPSPGGGDRQFAPPGVVRRWLSSPRAATRRVVCPSGAGSRPSPATHSSPRLPTAPATPSLPLSSARSPAPLAGSHDAVEIISLPTRQPGRANSSLARRCPFDLCQSDSPRNDNWTDRYGRIRPTRFDCNSFLNHQTLTFRGALIRLIAQCELNTGWVIREEVPRWRSLRPCVRSSPPRGDRGASCLKIGRSIPPESSSADSIRPFTGWDRTGPGRR